MWQTPGDVQDQDPATIAARADGWRLARAVAAWVVLGLAANGLSGSPEVLPVDAPPEVASGGRALEFLERIAREADGGAPVPRPVGSAANARCRDRIVAEWRRLGFDPQVDERTTVAERYAVVGTTRNVLVRLRGDGRLRGPGSAILCMAHYDSVGAGPGIGDDLSGVAALLEVARALVAGGGTARDVIFLVDDAEEVGLLGAEAFAQHHPWAEDVGAVLNFEARGASGPSRLFETGAGNADLVRAFGEWTTAPSASSVSVEVYRRMPNDTDFTVWQERGVPGLNFAFIGDFARYHTPQDDLEHLDPRSLQHQATNALEAVRALDRARFPRDRAARDLPAAPDAAFFDLAGRGLRVLGIGELRALAAALFLMVLLGVTRALGRGALRLRGIGGGTLGAGAAVGAALVTSTVHLGLLRGLGAPAAAFTAGTGVMALSVGAASLGALLVALLALARVASAAEWGAAVALLLSLAGMLLSWAAPGASFLVVLPVTVVAVTWFIFPRHGDLGARVGNAAVFAAGAAAVLWTPLHGALLDAFGAGAPALLAAPLLPCAVLLLPVFRRAAGGATRWLCAGLVALALASGAVASLVRPFTVDHPGRANLVHVQGADGDAVWQVMDVDGSLLRASRATPELERMVAALGGAERQGEARAVSWSGRPVVAAVTRRTRSPLPELEVLGASTAEGVRTLRLRVRSPRGGDQLRVATRGVAALRVLGASAGPRRLTWVGPGDGWCELEVDLADGADAEVVLQDRAFGLAGALEGRAEVFLTERAPERVPSHDGDGSVLIATFELERDRGPGPVDPVLSVEETDGTADGEGG